MSGSSVAAAQPRQSLQTEARVTVSGAGRIIDKVFEHFMGHDFEVHGFEDGAFAHIQDGSGAMVETGSGVVLVARADDLSTLAYIKSVLVHHFYEFASEPRPEVAWTGDGVDATTFPNFREMRVVSVSDITPHMRRVRLSGHDLERYATHGQHLKLFVPPAGVSEPEWPVPAKDGTMLWPSDEKRPRVRTYTVRKLDLADNILDVDFVMHGDHSVGSRWAMHASPGDIVGVRGPVGRKVPEADWYLLVGDETALPVIARTIEELPSGAKGVALIEVSDESEKQPIENGTNIEIRWLMRNGAEPGTTTQLQDAVRDIQMPPAGTRIHAMAGVEFNAFKAIRHYWRDELKLDKKAILPVAYWRRGKAEDEPAPAEDEEAKADR